VDLQPTTARMHVQQHMHACMHASQLRCPHVCMQVADDKDGTGTITFEFVAAKHNKVHDRVTLRNTLRRDGVCSYCFSRTDGMRRGGSTEAGACSPSSDISDLESQYAARLERELRGEEEEEGVGEQFVEDMAEAAMEMDMQSDDGILEEAEGFVRSFRSATAGALP
jgi:hypothetical protein